MHGASQPRSMASSQPLMWALAPINVRAMQSDAYYYFPFEAISFASYWAVVPHVQHEFKERWKHHVHKRNELNSQKGKRMGLAFIGSQLCLRGITIKIQFSSSKKPVKSILHPLFTHKEANITTYCPASCRKCHTNLQWHEQESHRLSESGVKVVSTFRK